MHDSLQTNSHAARRKTLSHGALYTTNNTKTDACNGGKAATSRSATADARANNGDGNQNQGGPYRQTKGNFFLK